MATGNQLLVLLLSPTGLLLLVCAIGVAAISVYDGRKGKLATSRWSNGKERNLARQLSDQQRSGNQRNAVSLYAGKPTLATPSPLYLPDAQRGIAVCGGPGSGKTFSIIDPAIRSAIDQEFPTIVYDFKYPSQTARLAGYAAKAGYEVRVFAPGFEESSVCNPLDFLEDQTDAETARQMAVVLNKNFKLSSQNTEDAFFSVAGDQLIEAVLMLAKSTPYPDVMMCQAILSLEGLTKRLQKADLDYWVRASFGQLLSVADSEKTVASIVATANNVFTRFMKKNILAAFCGKTTLPLNLDGKQLLILGMDREKRDVVGPLLATVLHMIVTRNVVNRNRKKPIVLAIDELPTLYLPSLTQWLNENREDGLCTMLGFQNLVQLEKVYGKELARAIVGGCATKAIFNPQEYDSAKLFSDFLGDEEVRYRQKSRGRSGGQSNASTADQERTRKLFEASQFLKLPTGKCILVNPGYSNDEESSVPIEQKIKIPDRDLRAFKKSEDRWKTVQKELTAASGKGTLEASNLAERYSMAESLFPLPQNREKASEQEQTEKPSEESKKPSEEPKNNPSESFFDKSPHANVKRPLNDPRNASNN
jgi:type IV secretory pathway TraG/TraD family ATPase VirD4